MFDYRDLQLNTLINNKMQISLHKRYILHKAFNENSKFVLTARDTYAALLKGCCTEKKAEMAFFLDIIPKLSTKKNNHFKNQIILSL